MLLNDFGAGGGSDYALPLPQLFGEGKTMYVDMKGHGHSREHRAVVSGVVVGAFIRIHQSLSRLDLRMCSLGADDLFVRSDEQEQAWRWVEPILQTWQADPQPPRPYAAGSWGPAAASALVARDGVSWPQEW